MAFDQFSLLDDVLCRTVTIAKDVVTRLVVPVAFVDVVLQLLHDALSSGHPWQQLGAHIITGLLCALTLRSMFHIAFPAPRHVCRVWRPEMPGDGSLGG